MDCSEKMLLKLPGQMKKDLGSYCRDHGIENMSELVRQAIAKYIYADYGEETLKLQGLNTSGGKLDELRDMLDVMMRYMKKMHINTLAYHAEIDDRFKDAAFKSANRRHDSFLESFRAELKNAETPIL